LQCNIPVPDLFWVSDEDMSKNSCNLITLPAHASLNILKTGTCEDYSVALTTLLRKAGYSKVEVMSVNGFNHVFNLVKFPGDDKYTFVDTTENGRGIPENVIRFKDTPLGESKSYIDRNVKISVDIIKGVLKAKEFDIKGHLYYDYCKLPIDFCSDDYGMFNCPDLSEIYGCDKERKYSLDYCRWKGGIIKSDTCEKCWYEVKDSSTIEGCCRDEGRFLGIPWHKTSCMDFDLSALSDYT